MRHPIPDLAAEPTAMPDPRPDALFAGGHEENFPVASWLLPAAIRPSVILFYAVARLGDDLADEGDMPPAERLAALARLQQGLAGEVSRAEGSDHGYEAGRRLREHCSQAGLSVEPALQLLGAFRHDSDFRPFQDWQEVDRYCAQSASPVGRFVLSCFYEQVPHDVLAASDQICTGLQLVNFAQDMGQDLRRGRPTLPSDVWPTDWSWQPGALLGWQATAPAQRRALSNELLHRARLRLTQGSRLLRLLASEGPVRRVGVSWLDGQRLRLELAAIVAGGLAMHSQVARAPEACWESSARLGKTGLLLAMAQQMPQLLMGRLR